MVWVALGLLAVFCLLIVLSALKAGSEFEDVENMEEDDD